jgi:hypothetical protein
MKHKEMNKAIEMRKMGASIKDISKTLDVAKSSVSLWVRRIKLTDEQKLVLENKQMVNRLKGAEANRLHFANKRNEYKNNGFEKAKLDDEFRVLCSLYWGEGSKNKNSFKLTNSDFSMLQVACRILKDYNKSLYIYYYKENNISANEIKKWWLSKLNNIDKIILYEQKISRASQQKLKGKLPHGTACLLINSTELVQMVYGGIEYLKTMGA